VARDRQRAKQRQAERRAKRLASQSGGERPEAAEPEATRPEAAEPDASEAEDSTRGRFLDVPGVSPGIQTGAPPENEGRSDTVLEDDLATRPTPDSEAEAIEGIEDWEVGADDHLTEEEIKEELEFERELAGQGEAGFEVRGRRGGEEAERHKHRPRVIQFLIAVWAELQRVQWPNRQAMITLTGVVLGFVLIAGGYLGLLDAIFSELVKAIL
jgi:preprotein translocase SecE subunit